jgi:hypothetical protein
MAAPLLWVLLGEGLPGNSQQLCDPRPGQSVDTSPAVWASHDEPRFTQPP